MNDEALDAPAEKVREASEEAPRPRSRRRRRGGRGRSSRGRGTEAPTESQASEDRKPEAGGKAAGKGTEEATNKAKDKATNKAPDKATDKATDKAPDKATGKESPSPARRRRRRRRSSQKSPAREAAKEASSGPTAKEKPARKTQGGKSRGAAKQEAPAKEAPAEPTKRRRRRSRGGSAKAEAAPAAKPAAATATRTRARGRGPGRRRRPPVQVPRRTDKLMLITEHGDRDQIAVIEGRELVEHYVTRVGASSMVGNIYLGKVQTVLPGMEAAFVDIGRGRNAVLYSGEVSYDEEVDEQERRIERALKAGQGVMVQVTKDPMGGKGARLTGEVSIPGRYLVLVPEGGASGISRRLPDKERSRLRTIMREIRPKKAGVIVRTAAEGASEAELKADLERLKKTWESIRRKSRRGRVPRPLYEEPELTVRVVRDAFSPTEFQKMVTDSRPVYEKVVAYLEDVAPDLVEKVEYHEGPLPVFEEYHVAEQIHKALERKVWLPSGGYLIVDRSEAMTVIDVNTGKHVGKTNLEETVAGTNIEAAKEIARQLRLRDIGGIIVIDFIDMLLQRNRDLVIKTLKEALAADRTRSQVFEITPLGLLEMTRKKVSAGLVESFSEPCPTCEGRGILFTHEA